METSNKMADDRKLRYARFGSGTDGRVGSARANVAIDAGNRSCSGAIESYANAGPCSIITISARTVKARRIAF
jgi:hypothetical protein